MNPFSGSPTNSRGEKIKLFRCCVAGCKTRASNGFHNFPTNKNVCLEWMRRTQKEDLNINTISKSYHKVCKNHFDEGDFKINSSGKNRLIKGATPSRNLPVILPFEHSDVN